MQYVQPRRDAVAEVTTLDEFIRLRILELFANQVREFQVLEHEVEEFLLVELEDELIHAFALVAGLATRATATAAGTVYAITANEFLVTGQDATLLAALSLVKYGFRNILFRNRYLFATIHVRDAAFAYRIAYCFFNVFSKPL